MKVIYYDKEKMFLVINEETETIINTDDVVEAKNIYLERIAWQFNNAICNRLKN